MLKNWKPENERETSVAARGYLIGLFAGIAFAVYEIVVLWAWVEPYLEKAAAFVDRLLDGVAEFMTDIFWKEKD